jgi:hypothetical protein
MSAALIGALVVAPCPCQDPSSMRELICSKTMALLEEEAGVTLRSPKTTVLDMAAAMLEMGAVQPARRRDEL